MMLGPFTATVLLIRQKTPMGVSFRMNIITSVNTAFALSTSFATGSPFSPLSRMPTPTRIAITITCSMFALVKDAHILLGKMFTMVSITLDAFASYSAPAVSSRGK